MESIALAIINIFDIFSYHMLMSVFLKKTKLGNWSLWVVYGLFYIVNTYLYVFVHEVRYTSRSVTIFLIIIVFLYRESIWLRVLAFVMARGIPLLLEFSSTASKSIFSSADVYNSKVEYAPIAYKIGSLLCVIVIALYGKRFKEARKYTTFSWENWLALLLFPITSIYAFFVLNNLWAFKGVNVLFYLLIICSVLIFSVYNDLAKKEKEKAKIMLYRSEEKNILTQMALRETSHAKLTKIQHDTRNHYSTLYKLLRQGKVDETLQYLGTLTEVNDESEVFSYTDVTALDGLIKVKAILAQKNQITINTNIHIPKDLPIAPYDWTIIIGNLLDNAIEATQKVASNKTIVLDISYLPDVVDITVKNPFVGNLKYDKNKNLQTTKLGDNHGYGLKNVEEAVENYNGDLNTSDNSGYFTAYVQLDVAKKQAIETGKPRHTTVKKLLNELATKQPQKRIEVKIVKEDCETRSTGLLTLTELHTFFTAEEMDYYVFSGITGEDDQVFHAYSQSYIKSKTKIKKLNGKDK